MLGSGADSTRHLMKTEAPQEFTSRNFKEPLPGLHPLSADDGLTGNYFGPEVPLWEVTSM
jgi:hypothetical protein